MHELKSQKVGFVFCLLFVNRAMCGQTYRQKRCNLRANMGILTFFMPGPCRNNILPQYVDDFNASN